MREPIEGKGCELAYLLAYSPDFNPIEEAFSRSRACCAKQERARRKLW